MRLKRIDDSCASRSVAANAANACGRTTSRHVSSALESSFPLRRSRPTGNVLLQRYDKYLVQHALSPLTIRNYLADLRAFLRWHAGTLSKPVRLVCSDFNCYRAHLCRETDHSTATVNRHLQSLRLFGRFLFEMGWIEQDPSGEMELVRNGSDKKRLPRILTPTEVARFCYAIRSGRPSLVQRDFAIVQLMLEAGLRVHEVAALRMDDLTPRRMRVMAHGAQKGGRVVPLSATAARAVRAYLTTRPAIPHVDHVFVSQRGQPLSVRSIQRLVDTYARSAGLKDVCAQSLRHTCAKSMLDQTQDDALVARRLGHCSTRMLKRYHHP